MTAANGYNPLRWSCANGGCYNVVHRPKIEVFAECFPGKIAVTDVDGSVEVNGRFLFLEFKGGEPRDLPVGQRLYFQRLTALSKKVVAIVVCADAETMRVRAYRTIWQGRVGDWRVSNLDDLKGRIRTWANKATREPAA